MRYISKTVFDRVYSQFKKVGLQPKKKAILAILDHYLKTDRLNQIAVSDHKIAIDDGFGVGEMEYRDCGQLLSQIDLFLSGHSVDLSSTKPSKFQANGRRLAELILGDSPKGDWEEAFQNQLKSVLEDFWCDFYEKYHIDNRSRLEEIRATLRPGFHL